MGVFTDFLAKTKTIDTEPPRDGLERAEMRQLRALMDRLGDPDYPAGFEATNEVQSIDVFTGTVDGGTFDLTVAGVTVAGLGYDADAAAIQTAVDVACDGVIPGYSNGDIAVTGGPLTTDPVVLTFSGASVAGRKHDLVTLDGSSLTGGGDVGEVTVVTNGQADRTAWAVLYYSGVVSEVPVQGEAYVVAAPTSPMSNCYYPDQGFIRALAKEAAIEDGNADVEVEILKAVGLA